MFFSRKAHCFPAVFMTGADVAREAESSLTQGQWEYMHGKHFKRPLLGCIAVQ
jgi:hypothetical protein